MRWRCRTCSALWSTISSRRRGKDDRLSPSSTRRPSHLRLPTNTTPAQTISTRARRHASPRGRTACSSAATACAARATPPPWRCARRTTSRSAPSSSWAHSRGRPPSAPRATGPRACRSAPSWRRRARPLRSLRSCPRRRWTCSAASTTRRTRTRCPPPRRSARPPASAPSATAAALATRPPSTRWAAWAGWARSTGWRCSSSPSIRHWPPRPACTSAQRRLAAPSPRVASATAPRARGLVPASATAPQAVALAARLWRAVGSAAGHKALANRPLRLHLASRPGSARGPRWPGSA
mmetsp:Transcript_2420/g.5908  ORF Transcript_2420/g.5908 Transcript_2420/m.5908 type:complete len:295 (+) Transcript_2420:2687-3571(+)